MESLALHRKVLERGASHLLRQTSEAWRGSIADKFMFVVTILIFSTPIISDLAMAWGFDVSAITPMDREADWITEVNKHEPVGLAIVYAVARAIMALILIVGLGVTNPYLLVGLAAFTLMGVGCYLQRVERLLNLNLAK